MNNEPEYTISNLNDCGCCEGVTVETAIEIVNRPSLPAIAYRIGEHADFKASMLAGLSSTDFASLKDLRTRNDNDFSIALLDAWAMVADVLTFYDQTLANESYLRTASERLSIFELARLIGYKPHPGVAASTLLAFTMDDLPGSPEKITLSVGTKVQSTPKQDEQAQLFETVEEIEARPAWNSIKPRLTRPHSLMRNTETLFFQGIATKLKPGDGVLFKPDNGDDLRFGVVKTVNLDQEKNNTRVTINLNNDDPEHVSEFPDGETTAPPLAYPASDYEGQTLSASEMVAEAKSKGFRVNDVFKGLSENPIPPKRVLVFRKHTAIFGHNAPDWESLPESLRGEIPIYKIRPSGLVRLLRFEDGSYKNEKDNWPGGNNGKLSIFDPTGPFGVNYGAGLVPLDNIYSEIGEGSFVVLKDKSLWGLYKIQRTRETSLSRFTITAKVTLLDLDSFALFDELLIRDTSAYIQSEWVPLAEIPIETRIPRRFFPQRLRLKGWVDGLYKGQQIVLSGLEIGGNNELVSEFVVLKQVKHILKRDGYTRITFSPALKHTYIRETVTINANVAPATHGETVQEVLGSGDATQLYQNFTLKQPPLTHVSASTPSGAQSTLEVRINDVLWNETDRLLGKGSTDRVFITHTNDAGETSIKFGNGDTGARLATGQDNIRAVYRKGIGTEGLVDAEQLNMLMSRPLGLKEATNPHAPTGAADPESRGDAQQNAPLTVMTLDRAVSLQDYEDFSRAFAGIAKSLAISALKGQGKTVFITIAGPDGALILDDSPAYEKLLSALAGAGDPLARFCIQSYRPVTFRFGGKVKIDPDYIVDEVLKKVELALRTAFSFEMRGFGQLVALSEVIAVIQDIAGVVAVDVDYLYRGDSQERKPRIIARAPVIRNNGQFRAAELLTLHPGPLDHLEVMA
ncbi:MAG: putative baseplate assembly protein [Methylococcales bacterium]